MTNEQRIAELEAENESLKKEVQETKNSKQIWYEAAGRAEAKCLLLEKKIETVKQLASIL